MVEARWIVSFFGGLVFLGYWKGDKALRQLYIPRNVSDYLADEALRKERDLRTIRNYQRRQAEQSAYRIRLQFTWFARLRRWVLGVLRWV